MAARDQETTQQDPVIGDVSELENEGVDDAEEIGRGSFGIVYRCRQPDLDRTVAIKRLASALDRDHVARFLREQRAMGRLSGHPNIVIVAEAAPPPPAVCVVPQAFRTA